MTELDLADRSGSAPGGLAGDRVAIEAVEPEIEAGRFEAGAVAGRPLEVAADVFADGHDVVRAAVLWRAAGGESAHEVEMAHLDNDRWGAAITLPAPGYYAFTVIAWRDLFASWRRDTEAKVAADLDVALEVEEGRRLVAAARDAAPDADRAALDGLAQSAGTGAVPDRLVALMAEESLALMRRAGPRTDLSRYPRELPVFADRERAAFSAWYEMMPRSQGPGTEHGTFDDVIARLPYVRDLGFDVLYFPPIHPIGRTNRKGRDNSLIAAPGDPGSPYAIGAAEGGHTGIHPELGSLADFDRLVAAARDAGLEIALDFAIQCAPDHPWVRDHPEWFDWRPDGTIKFAENPPKRYEDIVNVAFYGGAAPELWQALRDVVLFWIDRGVTIFRVDNPHTKPFPFWEWLIRELRTDHPEAIFLAEAFTRPKVMKRLAKIGFSQSYSYFTWRTTKAELTAYLTELTTSEARHTMRPNFFANTPDINPYHLQTGGRPAFRTRAILAGTLTGNYGLYNGFEICEAEPVPGREEYRDSEKYEIRDWDFDRPGHIKDDIRFLNRLRRENPALQDAATLRFYNAFNDRVLYYARMDPGSGNYLLFHVNLDPEAAQTFEFEVPLWEFGLGDEAAIEVEDMLNGNHFIWEGKPHRLTLEPETRPYAVWRLIPPGATEQ